ncbi:hypothetical protein ACFE04_005296 [Oxalis oulophora]
MEGGDSTDLEVVVVQQTKHQRKSKNRNIVLTSFGCLKTETDDKGSFDISVVDDVEDASPTHLLIMINGIIGSAKNWRYAAKHFLKKFPKDVIVYCSERNSAMSTFDGVDVMGRRLAEEVIDCIRRHPTVQKISFIGHSLGGLVARYAIALLFRKDVSGEVPKQNGELNLNGSSEENQLDGKVAGLEPINFITLATPHLGSRGHKQVPIFCGFHAMEKAASRMSLFLGRSGKHLFLCDKDNGKPPLLLQMASDSEDLKFISALQSFKRRVTYANIRFDPVVGWSTSSIRRRNELPKRQHLKRIDKYPYIVNVDATNSAIPLQNVPLDATTSNDFKHIEKEGPSPS